MTVPFDKLMQYTAVALGVMAGDTYIPPMPKMPGATWDNPDHPMNATPAADTSQETGNGRTE